MFCFRFRQVRAVPLTLHDDKEKGCLSWLIIMSTAQLNEHLPKKLLLFQADKAYAYIAYFPYLPHRRPTWA